jgi:hypothetical protein
MAVSFLLRTRLRGIDASANGEKNLGALKTGGPIEVLIIAKMMPDHRMP